MRRIAVVLAIVASLTVPAAIACKIYELVTSTNVNWPQLFDALGTPSRDVTVHYLADLIDPSAWKVTVADNERLLDRCRELEAENARLKLALAKGVER